MWNLGQARARVQDRLSETSPTFWDAANLNNYINDAQRLIAAITKGIPYNVTAQPINATTEFFSIPARTVGSHEDGFITSTGHELIEINRKDLKVVVPNWRRVTGGHPRWVSYDFSLRRAYVIPRGQTEYLLSSDGTELLDSGGYALTAPMSYTVTGVLAVLPDDLSSDTQALFNAEVSMEKYQGALLNLSVTYALLKERYDNDAERFYQFFINSMQQLGVDPERIPSLRQAAARVPVEQN